MVMRSSVSYLQAVPAAVELDVPRRINPYLRLWRDVPAEQRLDVQTVLLEASRTPQPTTWFRGLADRLRNPGAYCPVAVMTNTYRNDPHPTYAPCGVPREDGSACARHSFQPLRAGEWDALTGPYRPKRLSSSASPGLGDDVAELYLEWVLRRIVQTLSPAIARGDSCSAASSTADDLCRLAANGQVHA